MILILIANAKMLNVVYMKILEWFSEYIRQIRIDMSERKSGGTYGTKDGRILF